MPTTPGNKTPWRRRRPSRGFRRTVETLVVLLAVGIMLRTWCVQGLIVPFQVASGSMMPTLLGPYYRIVCANCGFAFDCAADRGPSGQRIVCPNCAHGGNAIDADPSGGLGGPTPIAGDRLLVDRTAFQLRAPRRWEVVAFRDPQHPSRALVKRVVGLPGEAIQIRDGDVYADGEIVRKTLPQQRATAVLVHDADFPPRVETAPEPRWQAEGNVGRIPNPSHVDSRWVVAGSRFTHPGGGKGVRNLLCEAPSGPSGQKVPDPFSAADWLVYVHRRRLPGPREQTEEAPISNRCSYNQTLGERGENLDPATDLMLSFRVVRASGQGELGVRIGDGWEEFEVWIDPWQGCLRVLRNGETLRNPATVGWVEPAQRALPHHGPAPQWWGCGRFATLTHPTFTVEVSTFDRQLLVALDGRPIVALPYQRTGGPMRRDSRRLAIGCRGLEIEIGNVQVLRDTYYTRPAGWNADWGGGSPARLGAGEYYVLGDNSPISDDSRTWLQGPGLSEQLFIGKPLLVHFPARGARFGGWHFQVPDLSKIRYIR